METKTSRLDRVTEHASRPPRIQAKPKGRLLTLIQAARRLKMNPRWVEALINAEEIPHYVASSEKVYLLEDDVFKIHDERVAGMMSTAVQS